MAIPGEPSTVEFWEDNVVPADSPRILHCRDHRPFRVVDHIHGRNFTAAEMVPMRSLIAASPQQVGAGLAREYCRVVGWVGPDDRIRAMMSRLTMRPMHRDGIIVLQAPQPGGLLPGTTSSDGRRRSGCATSSA